MENFILDVIGSEDLKIHFKYVEAVAKTGQIKEVELLQGSQTSMMLKRKRTSLWKQDFQMLIH